MQIEIRIDETCSEPKIIVLTDKMTEEVSEIVRRLSDESAKTIAGFREDTAVVLDTDSLLRVYASNGRVYAQTDQGEYRLKLRLYELEQRLDKRAFVRISNSEIIHLKRVKRFDLSFAGTICVVLSDGTTTYVSRRYVAGIRQNLGL
ncbi:MAG: LytTR family DNA-binding domain-containing protein [bacterium]|nr:LytTR family DNA-binding domain-containing protein [bacterium]